MPYPESLPLLTSPPGSAETVVPNQRDPYSRLFSCFVSFGVRKNGQKTDGQKIDFFRKFGRFRCLPRRFSAMLGPKTGPRSLFFRCFLKTVILSKSCSHCRNNRFQGSDPPKIGPESDSERQPQEKTTKTASGAVSRRTFSSLHGPNFSGCWAPGRVPK